MAPGGCVRGGGGRGGGKGGGRGSSSAPDSEPLTPRTQDSATSGTPISDAASTIAPNHDGSSSTCMRNVRGRTRGLASDSLIRKYGGSKIPVQWDLLDRKPSGPNASLLSNEIGFIIRNFAPLRVETWYSIEASDKTSLIDRILNKFELDLTNPDVTRYLHTSMSQRYNGFRNRLKTHFAQYPNLAEAKRHIPDNVTSQGDWDFLCDRFSTEKFKTKSIACSNSREKVLYVHRGGTKSFVQYQYEDRKGQKHISGPKGQVELFHDTHWTEDKGWINEQAESHYNEMVELQQTSDESSKLSEAAICERVLGKRSGYVKGLGFGPRPESSKSARLQEPDSYTQRLEIEVSELRNIVHNLVSEVNILKNVQPSQPERVAVADELQSLSESLAQ